MKYKTLVVDDELEAQKRLLLYLERFQKLELLAPAQNGSEALLTIRSQAPEIVFLDVEMPEMSGIEVLSHCKDSFPYVIFVTAYNQYAVEAFEQNAIDYVLKPYTFERIQKALDKAFMMIEKDRLTNINENLKNLLFALSKSTQENFAKAHIRHIAVKSIGETIFIPVSEVIYIEAADQYVEVHTDKKAYTVRESMDKLERTLNPEVFFRAHRSSIINLRKVIALENVDKHISLVILNNGRKVRISNSRKQDFKAKMNF